MLCGGTTALIRAGFETLVRAGYPPELAYFECLHELKFDCRSYPRGRHRRDDVFDFRHGKMGRFNSGPTIIDAEARKRMEHVLRKIRSGKFARDFIEK